MFQVNGYTLSFLIFSLFLAAIPLAISWYLAKAKKHPVNGVCMFGLWLIFFPNIPYLFTKGRYIIGYCGDTPWDLCGNTWVIGFFFLHAFAGVPAMHASLRWTTDYLKSLGRKVNIHIVAIASLFLSALATPIGLYMRLNSWDIFKSTKNHSLYL